MTLFPGPKATTMFWPRVLEPEVMDSSDEASQYDAMDHRAVNQQFVDDFLTTMSAESPPPVVLDLGTGTARIPMMVCCQHPTASVVGIDLSQQMLALGRRHVTAAGLEGRIRLEAGDAKLLRYPAEQFDAVVSNSIVHHIPVPDSIFAEAIRVAAPHGILFFRDLMRPADQRTWETLVMQYATEETPHARQLFADSLRAALTVDEVRAIVSRLGFDRSTVRQTSDRHWTWRACKRDRCVAAQRAGDDSI